MEEKAKSKTKQEKKTKRKSLNYSWSFKKRPKRLQSIDWPSTTGQGEPHTAQGPHYGSSSKEKNPKHVSILVQDCPSESEEQCLSRSSGLLENDPMDSEKSQLRKN